VLLVSSSKVPNKWVVPSGGVEPDEDFATAALREVAEEVSHFSSIYVNESRITLVRIQYFSSKVVSYLTIIELILSHWAYHDNY
jgi:predicted NUDIX family NTP pyrophosphohydrolase